jgi:hypothetical protein
MRNMNFLAGRWHMPLLFVTPWIMICHCILFLQTQCKASIKTVARCVRACSSRLPPLAASASAVSVVAAAAAAAASSAAAKFVLFRCVSSLNFHAMKPQVFKNVVVHLEAASTCQRNNRKHVENTWYVTMLQKDRCSKQPTLQGDSEAPFAWLADLQTNDRSCLV